MGVGHSRGSAGSSVGDGPRAIRIVRPERYGRDGWEVVRADGHQPSAIRPTREGAEARAREILVNVGGGRIFVEDGRGKRVATIVVERPGPRARLPCG